MSSKISINGFTYSGKSINIKNNKILIDGVDVTPNDKIINIIVSGNADIIQVDACDTVKVAGDVEKLTVSAGNVDIGGDVYGNVETSAGNIQCGNVEGNVDASAGNITCENIKGSAKATCGDINRR